MSPIAIVDHMRPIHFGLNGGWLNGSWTKAFFREFRSLDLAHARFHPVLQKPLIEAVDGVPGSWEFVPQRDSLKTADLMDWGFVRRPDGTFNLPLGREPVGVEQSRPFMRNSKTRQYLIPFYTETVFIKRSVRLLYVDDDIVSDVVALSLSGESASWEIPGVGFELSRNLLGTVERKSGRQIDPILGRPQGNPAFGPIMQLPSLQNSIARRLERAVTDGLLHWLGADVMLPNADGQEATSVRIDAPKRLGIAVEIAGTDAKSHRTAARSANRLQEIKPDMPVERIRPDSLAYIFHDGKDGILRVAEPTRLLGWWRFDPEHRALVNDKSGARVTYDGLIADQAGRIDRDFAPLRFTYEDSEVRRSIWVERVAESQRTFWRIDHVKSAALTETRASEQIDRVAYGLWRRIEDSVVDALLAWPETEWMRTPEKVASLGGWLNGTWVRDLNTWCRIDWPWNRYQDGEPVEPLTEPLSAEPPSPWRFVNTSVVERKIELDFVEPVSDGRFVLPAEKPLTGFEQRVPYVARDDGKAVIFPSHHRSDISIPREYYLSYPYLVYADERLVAEYLGWKIVPHWPIRFGLRDAKRKAELLDGALPREYFDSNKQPSLAFWRKVRTAFVDGYAAWSGTTLRMLDDPAWLAREMERKGAPRIAYEKSGVEFGRQKEILLKGGYVGGCYQPHLLQYVELVPRANSQKGKQSEDRMQRPTSIPEAPSISSALARVVRFGRRKPN